MIAHELDLLVIIVYFNEQETSVWNTAGHPSYGDGLQPVHTFQTTMHDTNNCLEGFSSLISLDQISSAAAAGAAADNSVTPILLTNDVSPTNQDADTYNLNDLMQNVPDECQPVAAQFSCNETGCSKSYTTISGLNNHIKK